MKKKRKRDKIIREIPPIGTDLKGRYKRTSYKAKIVKDSTQKSGKAIKYAGKLFPSMTAASKMITKQSTNGWLFWKF